MKKRIKYVMGILLFLLIPGIFGGFGAFPFFSFLKPQMDAKVILKKGVETTANIIEMDTNITLSKTNGIMSTKENIYYLIFSFIDSEGNEIEYKSASIYPKTFIHENSISAGEPTQIIYLGKKAVVKNFKPNLISILWVFTVVFELIALGFLVLLVLYVKWDIDSHIIKKLGTTVVGTFVNRKGLFKFKDSNVYSIFFSYTNHYNETVEAQTRFLYTEEEVDKLEKKGQFPIAFKGNKAIIIRTEN